MAMSASRNRMLVLLGVSLVLGIGAAVVGIDDNPVGILLGVGSAVAFLATFAHTWRKPEYFRRMIYASIAGAVIFAVASSLIETASDRGSIPAVLDSALNVIAIVVTLLIPASLLVGVVGAVLTWRLGSRNG